MRSSYLRMACSLAAFTVAIMLPAASRAFAPAARRMVVTVTTKGGVAALRTPIATVRGSSWVVRSMSSTTEGGESKTVVDICREKIEQELETDKVVVRGAFDDPNGAHIMIDVISDKFAGKRPVQRQQMVYKALWEELKDPGGIVHAVDGMSCKTPEEAG